MPIVSLKVDSTPVRVVEERSIAPAAPGNSFIFASRIGTASEAGMRPSSDNSRAFAWLIPMPSARACHTGKPGRALLIWFMS
jgi:hypothetical protein